MRAVTALTPEQRFFAKIEKQSNGCWIWQSTVNPYGYGGFWFEGKSVFAHRWAYERIHGSVPKGLVLRHSCDTPSCVNPDHLSTGTTMENSQDAKDRGRLGRSANRLDETTAKLIRAKYVDGFSPTDIAKQYGVSLKTVYNVGKGRTWAAETADVAPKICPTCNGSGHLASYSDDKDTGMPSGLPQEAVGGLPREGEPPTLGQSRDSKDSPPTAQIHAQDECTPTNNCPEWCHCRKCGGFKPGGMPYGFSCVCSNCQCGITWHTRRPEPKCPECGAPPLADSQDASNPSETPNSSTQTQSECACGGIAPFHYDKCPNKQKTQNVLTHCPYCGDELYMTPSGLMQSVRRHDVQRELHKNGFNKHKPCGFCGGPADSQQVSRPPGDTASAFCYPCQVGWDPDKETHSCKESNND